MSAPLDAEAAGAIDPPGALNRSFGARLRKALRRHPSLFGMPALLLAILSVRSPNLMAEVFERVIDSPKMLRTFVQIMRSGVVGRKSLGSLPKRLVQQWLDARDDEALFCGSIGNAPSLADVLRMVHPKPQSKAREALYGYLIGRQHDAAGLPDRWFRPLPRPALGTRRPTPRTPAAADAGSGCAPYSLRRSLHGC